MASIIIEIDESSSKLLLELAKKLGARALRLGSVQVEELMLGTLMDQEKTGELVSRDKILRKLRRHEG
jgi:hypothetical protein